MQAASLPLCFASSSQRGPFSISAIFVHLLSQKKNCALWFIEETSLLVFLKIPSPLEMLLCVCLRNSCFASFGFGQINLSFLNSLVLLFLIKM